ncbi:MULTISPECIES: hypothetical protein [Cupriavidus]|uniref:Uncharacterized protein n=1 Tax=Cupriavidus campinensis TaxID=151783 RepID=A0ABY3EUM0_9BURK|nr:MULTISPECIES: hypothetical protein [Cupriavidus]TSP14647.1 hypothetical protein FGG12_03120 [Cupriavidus campinensis]
MALNARNLLPARSTKASKPSKQLRPRVVAMQQRGMQVLLAQADTAASKPQPSKPVRSAYTSTLRVTVSKSRLTVK